IPEPARGFRARSAELSVPVETFAGDLRRRKAVALAPGLDPHSTPSPVLAELEARRCCSCAAACALRAELPSASVGTAGPASAIDRAHCECVFPGRSAAPGFGPFARRGPEP